MEKLNFSAFSNITERDKKILNALYKLLHRKFDIQKAFTWDMVDYLSTKISDTQLPLLDVVNYLYTLKFNMHFLTDTYKFDSPVKDLDIDHIVMSMKEIVFKTLMDRIVKKESFLNSVKKCFENKELFRYVTPAFVLPGSGERTNIVKFDADDIELGKVYLFYTTISVNDEYLKGIFVEIKYGESDESNVKVIIKVGDTEESFTLPSFWEDLRHPNEENLLKFICKDLVPYYIKTIKKQYSIQ